MTTTAAMTTVAMTMIMLSNKEAALQAVHLPAIAVHKEAQGQHRAM
jgi:hypothetical protein